MILSDTTLGFWLAPPAMREKGFFPYVCDNDHETVAWVSKSLSPRCWYCGKGRYTRRLKIMDTSLLTAA